MISMNMYYIAVGVIAAIADALLMFFLLRTKKNKESGILSKIRLSFFGYIICIITVFFATNMILTTVIVLDDTAEGKHSKNMLLSAVEFAMKNGQTVHVAPTESKYLFKTPIVINNTETQHEFEVVIYTNNPSSTEDVPSQDLAPYSITNVSHDVKYIYENPPNSITTKSSGSKVHYYGWIH